jgi:hypothetical protein
MRPTTSAKPETGLTDNALTRVKNGRLLLIPASPDRRRRGTTANAPFYQRELEVLLQTRRSGRCSGGRADRMRRYDGRSGGQPRGNRDANDLRTVLVQHAHREAAIGLAFGGKLRRDPRRFRAGRDAAAAALPFGIVEAGRPIGDLEEVPHATRLLCNPSGVMI